MAEEPAHDGTAHMAVEQPATAPAADCTAQGKSSGKARVVAPSVRITSGKLVSTGRQDPVCDQCIRSVASSACVAC